MKIGISSALAITAAIALFFQTAPAFADETSATPAKPPPAAPKPSKKEALRLARPQVGTVPEDITPEAAEVVWLFHKGFANPELLSYVNRSHQEFHLSVEDVNYLKDIGISSDVVFAMLRNPKAREDVAGLQKRVSM